MKAIPRYISGIIRDIGWDGKRRVALWIPDEMLKKRTVNVKDKPRGYDVRRNAANSKSAIDNLMKKSIFNEDLGGDDSRGTPTYDQNVNEY